MFIYDQDTRRQMAAERVEQMKRDAMPAPASRRRRRRRREIMRRAAQPFVTAMRRQPKTSPSA